MRGVRRVPVSPRATLLLSLVLVAVYALDVFAPLGAAPTDQAIFGWLIAIGSAIWHAFHTVADITVAILSSIVHGVGVALIALGRAVKSGLWIAGRATSKVLRALGRFATDSLPRFFRWAYQKIKLFETWLRNQFAPVFKFLKRVRDELNLIYKRFVRPILDTIDFIRALNRVLQTFGIDLLAKLDATLAKIEQKIEEPFLFIYRRLTEVENWVNRIVTLDGFFQRLTLIASLDRYAPTWIRMFWSKQIDPSLRAGDEYSRSRAFPVDPAWVFGRDLGLFYRGEANRMTELAAPLVPIWREAANVEGRPLTGD